MKIGTPWRVQLGAFIAAVALLSGLTGCAPSPTSTYTNAAGEEVTVNWRDYPLQAHVLAEDLASVPDLEDVEAFEEALFADIKAALNTEFSLDWATRGEASYNHDGGNGYGGKAMTSLYNSTSWETNSAPVDTASWERIVEIVSAVTTRHGLGSIQLGLEQDSFTKDAEWQKELLDKYGTADPGKLWWWDGIADKGSQWLSFYIHNVDRDATGNAAKEQAESNVPPRSISISYGTSTVSKADRDALAEALKPFSGLTPPEPTTSN